MRKTLFINAQNIDEIICQSLENGIIIKSEFHEFCHIISALFSFINKSESLIARKKNRI